MEIIKLKSSWVCVTIWYRRCEDRESSRNWAGIQYKCNNAWLGPGVSVALTVSLSIRLWPCSLLPDCSPRAQGRPPKVFLPCLPHTNCIHCLSNVIHYTRLTIPRSTVMMYRFKRLKIKQWKNRILYCNDQLHYI